jgi:8-oxo-dGTP diphosphatase
VTLLLLRHVHAGDRASWDGDDRDRPISATGRRQALAVVEQYADRGVGTIIASPYTRCVQSVQPLAADGGLPIEEVDELAEGTPLDVVDRLLRAQARHAEVSGGAVVLCTHGDILGMVVTHLGERGVILPAGPPRWPKASTWVLDGAVDAPEVSYLPPPA